MVLLSLRFSANDVLIRIHSTARGHIRILIHRILHGVILAIGFELQRKVVAALLLKNSREVCVALNIVRGTIDVSASNVGVALKLAYFLAENILVSTFGVSENTNQSWSSSSISTAIAL